MMPRSRSTRPPADARPMMAYACPPTAPTHPRIKKWNQDHGRHPYRDDDLVERLRDVLRDDDKIVQVLDVLSSVCLACWFDRDDCQCHRGPA